MLIADSPVHDPRGLVVGLARTTLVLAFLGALYALPGRVVLAEALMRRAGPGGGSGGG